ncbi:MAG: hypothetical protein KF752_03145 [Pirellulaceae bacterium]|nr:hypothetical protein [Pirellulaceae bacterium]
MNSLQPDRYQVLEALQATAEFTSRRGVTDGNLIASYFELILEAIVRGLTE